MCAHAQVRSSLIFSHANEGVGAKITRPIFPPPQWGHYLLMFCIFPPPSHSHAFFILSLLLGSSRCHPVTISVYFQQLLKHNVFTIIEDDTVKPSVLCDNKNHNCGLGVCVSEMNGMGVGGGGGHQREVAKYSISDASGFCIQSQISSKNMQADTLSC